MLASLTAGAQISQMLYQGFEQGESVNYVLTGTGSTEVGVPDLHSSGDRSMKLSWNTQDDDVLILDTLDFTQDLSLSYISLEFDHICNVPASGGSPVASVYYKLASENDLQWTRLTGTHYNTSSGSASTQFGYVSTFNVESYDNWHDDAMTNDHWHSERFDLNTALNNVAAVNRKIIIKFELKKKTSSAALNGQGWWLDNIVVRASSQQMVKPVINMLDYPDGGDHPNTRQARICLRATTVVQQGINTDSVYMYYQYGAQPMVRQSLSPVSGSTTDYEAFIPFDGFDTTVRFYCVVKDATLNENTATYPAAMNSWIDFHFSRSHRDESAPAMTSSANENAYPFGPYADNRSEIVYDSFLMSALGYGPGSITKLIMTRGTNQAQPYTRPNFKIRMKNMPFSFTVSPTTTGSYAYTQGYWKTVYSTSSLTIPAGSAGTDFEFELQDTFFYAGHDLMVQFIYDGTTDDNRSVSVKVGPASTGKNSLMFRFGEASYNYNPELWTATDDAPATRPVAAFTSLENKPLIYDMGIGAITYPTGEIAMTNNPGETFHVRLNNYGVKTVNAVRISYLIDGTDLRHYDWTGPMNGLSANNDLVIANDIQLDAGFHTLKVWVEDTLTAGGSQYRDHEPLNDTSYVEFIVCEGAMSGVRNIGGPDADYNTIEEFLFSLWQCGVDGPLRVRLADGDYPPFTMPVVNGLSAANYIQFEGMGTGARIVSTGNGVACVDVRQAHHMRFKDIAFVRSAGTLQSFVELAATSADCRFTGCSFVDGLDNPAAAMRIPAALANNKADSLTVDSCHFTGATIGVSFAGTSTLVRSTYAHVAHSTFANQFTSAVRVENITGVEVVGNEMNDVTGGQYVVYLNEVDGNIDVARNRIYSTHGAGGLGIGRMVGTQTRRAIVANNIIVSADDGTATSLTTPFNVQQAQWTDIVYNSVKLTAPNRTGNSAATFGSSGNIDNSRFLNNIITTYDTRNYAFNYNPGTVTTATVGHNVYFSNGATLNRKGVTGLSDLTQWMAAVPEDSLSKVVDPAFTEATPTDLRTFNRAIYGMGLPLTTVTTDILDSLRNDSASCAGAFEFEALHYDFALEAVLSPEADYCHAPDSVEVVLTLRNVGIWSLAPTSETPLRIYYSVNGAAADSLTVGVTVPAEDSVTVHTGTFLQLPANGIYDAEYAIRLWTAYPSDPNQTNDTIACQTISRYAFSAPAPFLDSTAYDSLLTVTITDGVVGWPVYENSSAPLVPSTIYWYADSTTTEWFHKGNTYTTPVLRNDTTFYIRQRRSLPVVRITQVQLPSVTGAVGAAQPNPSWNSGLKMGISFTNVGDDTATFMANRDTLYIVSNVNNFAKKAIPLTNNIVLAPGETRTLGFKSGTSSNAAAFFSNQNFQPNATTHNYALVYKSGDEVVDAVVFNDINATAALTGNWTSLSVPSYVWSGNGLAIASHTTSAGVKRVGYSGTATDWVFASNSDRLNYDPISPSMMLYVDNGCEGDFTTARVTMIAPPVAEPELSDFAIEGGCGINGQTLSLAVANYGSEPLDSIVMHYSVVGLADTVTDTLVGAIASGAQRQFSFAQTLTLGVPYDSVVTVRVWADDVAHGNKLVNDTVEASALVLYAPTDVPAVVSPQQVQYASSGKLYHVAPEGLRTQWTTFDGTVLGTGDTLETAVLYEADSVLVAYLAEMPRVDSIATGTGVAGSSTSNMYPSPYQVKDKYSRQQYIFTAARLTAAGVQPGPIGALSFYFDDFNKSGSGASASVPDTSITFANYSIGLAQTTLDKFATKTAWQPVEQVFFSDSLRVSHSAPSRWIEHRFNNAFVWDGVSNLVVEVAYECLHVYDKGLKTRYTTNGTNTVLGYSVSATGVTYDSISHFAGQGAQSNRLPQIKFESYDLGCNGPSATMAIGLVGVPTVDANLMWAAAIDTNEYSSCAAVVPMVNVRNQGFQTLDSFNIDYYFGSPTYDTVLVVSAGGDSSYRYDIRYERSSFPVAVAPGTTQSVPLFSRVFMPGRYTLTAVVRAAGDSITTNDTIYGHFTVRFCGGLYTIDTAATADYHTLAEALDTLNTVATVGAITFQLGAVTVDGQAYLGPGAVAKGDWPFVFTGMGRGATTLRSTQTGYALKVENISDVTIQNLTLASAVTGNSGAHVLVVSGVDNLLLNHVGIVVRANENDVASTGLQLGGNVSNLTIEDCHFLQGGIGLGYTGNVQNYANVTIRNSSFVDFQAVGVKLKGVGNFVFEENSVVSSGVKEGHKLTGVDLEAFAGTFSLRKNTIYLADGYKGGKIGLVMKNVVCDEDDRGYVVNNMISGHHGGDASDVPYGIKVDGTSANLNFYFNSVRIDATGTKGKTSAAFYSESNVTGLNVMNNIFANVSTGTNAGYAYYIKGTAGITISDYNNYFAGGTRLAYWGGDKNTLALLQAANNDDNNSQELEPYFTNDTNLHLMMTNLGALAQYNSEVPDDIDGRQRSEIPSPTIGAHEVSRCPHDVSIVRVISPTVPANAQTNPTDVETDPIIVTAEFYNNGSAIEENVRWVAYLYNPKDSTRAHIAESDTVVLGTMNPSGDVTSTAIIIPPLGTVDTNAVWIEVFYDGIEEDCDSSNNTNVAYVFLAPAFNTKATSVTTSLSGNKGCELYHTPLTIRVTNEGEKAIPAGDVLTIGYRCVLRHASGVGYTTDLAGFFPNLPVTFEEQYTLPTAITTSGSSSHIDIDFTTLPDLYPYDTALNIQVDVIAWAKYAHDLKPTNDTTASALTIKSFYTPAAPVGHDTTLPYATWGQVTAEQENSLAINWYRDPLSNPFISYSSNNASNYNNSRTWKNTPMFLGDSTYLLRVKTTEGCWSDYSTVTVHTAARKQKDVGIAEVLAPVGNRVYMENDTVRVRISNYGTAAQSNIPVVYEITQGTAHTQTVTENCTQSIAPGATATFTFSTLAEVPTANKTYKLRVWTNLSGDQTRRNDTLRLPFTSPNTAPKQEIEFKSKANTYTGSVTKKADFNISRIVFSGVDFEIPSLGRTYTNLGAYPDPEVPTIHVYRGFSDSLFVSLVNMGDNLLNYWSKVAAYIDFDRSGTFSSSECVMGPVNVRTGTTGSELVTIPATASYGYMKMRIVALEQTNTTPTNPSEAVGHMVDFLIFVDPTPKAKDAAIAELVSPRNYLVSDTAATPIVFRLSNLGQQPLTGVEVHYTFSTPEGDSTGLLPWTGNLATGESELLSLPPFAFPMGTTEVTIWHSLAGDAYRGNDTLRYEYHRFHILTLTYDDDFDGEDLWYAPKGYNAYTRNYWERGNPAKTKINTTHSGENAWVTSVDENIRSGERGNVSYLYTPIFNIAEIRTDSLSFWLTRNLQNGSKVTVDYLNYRGEWLPIETDSLHTLYHSDSSFFFGGNGGAYVHSHLKTTQQGLSGEFPELVQFRFTYTAPIGTATTNFGEGVAIDDFRLRRNAQQFDAGVLEILEPDSPIYGETVYPRVVVKNFGYDTLRQIDLGYTCYGAFLARQSTLPCLLPPDGIDTFTYTQPLVITADFPTEFEFRAFTMVSRDIYWDNDTAYRTINLTPMKCDISAVGFVRPIDQVVAGDSVTVTMRVQNFGFDSIPTAQFTYVYNRTTSFTETVDFNEVLGHPLQTMEYFNYTFRHKVRASMGNIHLQGIIKCDSNQYVYNDTIEKYIVGITAIRDLAAAGLVFDTVGTNQVRLSLIVENRGSLGANDFEVGFWRGTDTAHRHHTVFHRNSPLPALHTTSVTFDTIVNPSGGAVFTGYVFDATDNDHDNDTTTLRVAKRLDLEASSVIVEENEQPTCRVFLRVDNWGNIPVGNRTLSLQVTVNGVTLNYNTIREITPSSTVLIEFPNRIPKDPQRHYVGSGQVTVDDDADLANNITSLVVVSNMVENGIPGVGSTGVLLEQNRPNPTNGLTIVPFTLPSAGQVELFVVDAMGHRVQSLNIAGVEGDNRVTLDLSHLPSGIYYYGIRFEGMRQMRKLILR